MPDRFTDREGVSLNRLRLMPVFWIYETSGALRPAVEAYLRGGPMTEDHVAAMRAYIRRWIFGGDWRGAGVADLREGIDALTTRAAITAWLGTADALGIDPL